MTVLRYQHRYAQDQWAFLERMAVEAASSGKAPPKAISERPYIAEENLDMWQAFADLSRARACGFAPEPIPCSEVEAWCRVHGVEPWQVPSYWRVVQALDMEALRHHAQKAAK